MVPEGQGAAEGTGPCLGFTAPISPLRPGSGPLPSKLRDLWCLPEMDDETGRDASAIGARAGGFKAYVVHLGTEGQMRQHPMSTPHQYYRQTGWQSRHPIQQ